MSEQEQFEQEQQNRQPEQTEQTLQMGAVEQGGQEQQPDNGIYATPDVYQSQTTQEIYQTPTGQRDTGGVFSGNRTENDSYVNNIYGNGQPENNVYGNSRFENGQYKNGQYENGQYGNPYGNPYNPDSYGYNPYSPYAVPPQKKNTGLIIGIIVGVGVLFLIAVFALFYHAIDVLSAQKDEQKNDAKIEEFYQNYFSDDFHDDKNYKYNDRNDFFDHDDYDDHDDDRDHDYDRDYDYDRDDHNSYDDDEYYTLHDDIRNLSYSIDWEYFDYDANGDNVIITIEYPVVRGGNIPNRDKINNAFEEEAAFFVEYYEDEYSKYMNNSDSYFYVSATGYVTYMSEDVLSVVFSEYVYSDYFDSVSLYCINIDVQNGVILDNTDILSADDDFSVDFRYRSEKQNGTIDELDRFTDQEITQMLKSSGNLIIFYTPQGLEVGLNYDEGYVTVTYHDYKDYLKTF